ncbi:MAG: undecaprenyl phosphate-alpha-L-ara4N flippase subunit ArnE [Bacteroidia bacterium]|jgi:undecaprenyl phosphate-alpha-L-ara4N flippase subunit ArnE
MEVYGYISILIMSALVTIAQVLLKRNALRFNELSGLMQFGAMLKNVQIWIAFLCTGLAPLFYIAALWVLPLNKAFMLTSINLLIVPIAGKFYFNEKLGAKRLIGIGLILSGILISSFK